MAFGSASSEFTGKEKVYSDKNKIFFIGATENGDGNILYRKFGGGLKDGDYHVVSKEEFQRLMKEMGYTSTGESNDSPKIYEGNAPDIPKEQAEGLIPAETRLPSGQQVASKQVDKQVKEAEKKEGQLRHNEMLPAGAKKSKD